MKTTSEEPLGGTRGGPIDLVDNRFEEMLLEKSSSRVGRLNKNQ